MANDLEGEFPVKLTDGKEHIVSFDASGLRELELVFGRPVLGFLDDARKNMTAHWGYRTVHGALLAGLRRRRPAIDEQWLNRRFSPRVLDMLGYANVLTSAILVATMGPDVLREDDDPGPEEEAPAEEPRPTSISPGAIG